MPRLGIVFLMLISSAVLIPAVSVAQPERGISVEEREQVEASWYPHSHALIIGIDNYSHGWPKLQSAVWDAKNMAEALEERGFEVVLLLDDEATRENILKNLRDTFRKRSGSSDRFVMYFAGHGQDMESPRKGGKTGYFIPFDGKLVGGEHELSSYVSMEEIKDTLLDLYESRHIFIIADACFSGLLATRSGISPTGSVTGHLRKQGVNVLSAGEQDQLAADGLFTNILLKGLSGEADVNDDGFISFGELGLYVQQDVSSRTNSRQTPYFGHLSGGQGQVVFQVPRIFAHLVVGAIPKEDVKLEITGPEGERIEAANSYDERRMKPGAWKVRAAAEGYDTEEKTIELAAGQRAEMSFELKKLGILEVVGKPEGADVVVEGPSGVLSGKLPFKAGSLKSGTYRVVVSGESFEKSEQTVEVESGKENRLTVNLTEVAETRQAMIYILGDPVSAKVRVDGPSGPIEGVLPLVAENIEPGKYEIRIQQEGYEEHRVNVYVDAGEQEYVEVDLNKTGISGEFEVPGGSSSEAGIRVTISVSDGVLFYEQGTTRTHLSSELTGGLRLGDFGVEVGGRWMWESPTHVFLQPAALWFPLEEFYVRGGVPVRVYEELDWGGALGIGSRLTFSGIGVFADVMGMVLSGGGLSEIALDMRVGVELSF